MLSKAKGKLTFFRERCKGCSLCTAFCPQKVLELSEKINALGYHPAELTEDGECNACGICARMCPDVVITVERVS